MKKLKKLNRQEMKSISGGAAYSCRCSNGKTVTIVGDSAGIVEQAALACGSPYFTCVNHDL